MFFGEHNDFLAEGDLSVRVMGLCLGDFMLNCERTYDTDIMLSFYFYIRVGVFTIDNGLFMFYKLKNQLFNPLKNTTKSIQNIQR